MKQDEINLAWQAFARFRDDAIHFEDERQKVAVLLTALQTAVLAFSANAEISGPSRLAVVLCVVFIALFAAVFTLKLRQYSEKGYLRAAILFKKIDASCSSVGLVAAFDAGEAAAKAAQPRVSKVSLTWLWISLNIGIAALTSALLIFGAGVDDPASGAERLSISIAH